jgi:hypothetical protein
VSHSRLMMRSSTGSASRTRSRTLSTRRSPCSSGRRTAPSST